jgi:hypothetical protein
VYSSSKGIIRLCDMRQSALCDTQAKVFEEREDPSAKNFFSEIISSISDVKFSHSGRYLCTRDYLNVKVWDLNMENRPVETYSVHDYLRNKLCILYENDCIFDKFECSWSSNDDYILTGSYNNFFKSFHRNSKQDQLFECSREQSKPRQLLRPKKVVNTNITPAQPPPPTTTTTTSSTEMSTSPSLKRSINSRMNGNGVFSTRDEVNVDNLDFTKKILHTSWHPKDNLIAIAATNNLYIFYNKDPYSHQHQMNSNNCIDDAQQVPCSDDHTSTSSSLLQQQQQQQHNTNNNDSNMNKGTSIKIDNSMFQSDSDLESSIPTSAISPLEVNTPKSDISNDISPTSTSSMDSLLLPEIDSNNQHNSDQDHQQQQGLNNSFYHQEAAATAATSTSEPIKTNNSIIESNNLITTAPQNSNNIENKPNLNPIDNQLQKSDCSISNNSILSTTTTQMSA